MSNNNASQQRASLQASVTQARAVLVAAKERFRRISEQVDTHDDLEKNAYDEMQSLKRVMDQAKRELDNAWRPFVHMGNRFYYEKISRPGSKEGFVLGGEHYNPAQYLVWFNNKKNHQRAMTNYHNAERRHQMADTQRTRAYNSLDQCHREKMAAKNNLDARMKALADFERAQAQRR